MQPLPGGGGHTGDELVAQIADALATTGKYVRTMTSSPTQDLVDVNWCAHRAGRQLGIRVRVLVEGPVSTVRNPTVTVTVTPRRGEQLSATLRATGS